MTIEEIKDIIKDVPVGSKGLAMGHPILEDVNYHLQQLFTTVPLKLGIVL